jgi:hypothetical protein
MKYVDLTNQKFNRLTVLERDQNRCNRVMWKCRCDCGNIISVSTNSLKSGNSKSCGCYKLESFTKITTKHHLSNTRIYNIWKDMRKRCNNPNSSNYKNYGGRGITICDEWENNFMSFYNWSMNNGYSDSFSIDRINNDGNYEPSNCRWVDRKTQNSNTRQNHFITYNGKTLTITQWGKEYNINPHLLRYRLNNGWSIEKALTTPVKR